MPDTPVSDTFAPVEVATLDSHYDSQEALEGDQNLDVTALAKSIAGRKAEPTKPDAIQSAVDAAESESPEIVHVSEDAKAEPREDGAKWNAKAGRWQKADGSFAEGAAPEDWIDASRSATAPDEATPETKDAPPRKTSYEAYDGDDTVEVPESLTVKFTAANGKEYTKNIDGVVELAKHGIYNHELQQEVRQAREEVPQLRAQVDELRQAPEKAAEYVERLFTDMHFLASEIEAFEQSNTPTARAERAERALQEEREKFTHAATERQVTEYSAAHINAPLAGLLTQYASVTAEETMQHFAALIAPFKVNGRVPPQSLPTVAALVQTHVTPWVAQLHAHRLTSNADADAKSKAQQDAKAKSDADAQKKVLSLKRQVARAVAPNGASGTPASSGQRKPAKNYREAADAALDKALKSVRVS